jgi:hypothetical protein
MWCSFIPLQWNPWGWQLVVETYVEVFNIHYTRILFSALVGCYEESTNIFSNVIGDNCMCHDLLDSVQKDGITPAERQSRRQYGQADNFIVFIP